MSRSYDLIRKPHQAAMALQRLRWSSDNGEWSASIPPNEARSLLSYIEELEAEVGELVEGETNE